MQTFVRTYDDGGTLLVSKQVALPFRYECQKRFVRWSSLEL